MPVIAYDIIRRPIITEKSTYATEQNKYVFIVKSDANKKQVKIAIEKLFTVTVEKVNILNIKGKTKRFRGKIGQRSDIKKAIVTLKHGNEIDFSSEVK